MSGKIQVSNKEKSVLIIFLVLLAVAAALFLLLGRLASNTSQPQSSNKAANIALILPLRGDQAWIGTVQREVADAVLVNYQERLEKAGWSVNLEYYHSGNDTNTPAKLADQVARDLSTVAVIAPYDSRQTLAVAEIAAKKSLPVLAPASTHGIFSQYPYDNLYTLVNQGSQEEALVEILYRENLTLAYLVVQPEFSQSWVNAFNAAAQDRIHIAANLLLDDQAASQFAATLENLEVKPNVILYFGEPAGLNQVLSYMAAANIQLPVYSTDTINNANLLTFNRPGIDIFYTSPYFNAGQVQVPQSAAVQIAGQYAFTPYAYETALAVELVLETLLNGQPSRDNRGMVYRNIDNVVDPETGSRAFSNGTRNGAKMYLYYLSPDQTDWNKNPIVATFE